LIFLNSDSYLTYYEMS